MMERPQMDVEFFYLDTNFFQKIMLDEQKLILPSHFGIGVFFVKCIV